MSFADEIVRYPVEQILEQMSTTTASRVEQVLAAERINERDLITLLSPAAEPYIEAMAQKAHQMTRQRFGNTIQLYTPMYLSNECNNGCKYCGFNANNRIPRVTLTLAEIEQEAQIIRNYGFRSILLLTGEHPKKADNDYLAAAVKQIKPLFSSISIEVYPMDTEGYQHMVAAGVDGLTIYQETYDRELYKQLHPFGKKSDYRWRIEAPDRAGQAGLRRIGVGALLGLGPFATEAFYTGFHAYYLSRHYWRSQVSISFPRIRPADGGFAPMNPVSDKQLVQMVCAMRLLIPDAGLFLSTRENARLRDSLMRLGITHMSAGSCTAPGGHANKGEHTEQFVIDDDRTPEQISAAIRAQGYEAVWKDWDSAFLNASAV